MSQMNKKRPLHGKKTEKSDNFLGRVSIKTIVLSVVALIQMMLLITGTTFSWVETISSLALTGGGKIDNPVKTVANIGSGSGYDKELDLDAYFKKAGNVHLSTCSSADGSVFYFPIVGEDKLHRQSTVNDRNVNYISYNLKVVNKENKSKDFKFGKIPSIKIGNEAVTDNRVRVAITVDGVTKIFSNKDATEKVVAATDGTLSDTTVNAFGKYTNSDEKVTLPVFSIPANSKKDVKISLWLQESTTSNNDNNGDVAVNDFTLVVSKKCVEVKYGTDSDSTMGDISIGSNNQQICYGEEGDTITLNATAKPGYKFMGWYKYIDCTIKAPVTDGEFKIGSDSKYTLYALFKKTYTVNVFAVTDNDENNHKGGTVQINSDVASTNATKNDVTVGETVKLTATPNEGYDFVGWYDAITGGKQVYSEGTTNIELDSKDPKDITLYARFEIKKYTVTASAVSEDDDDNIQGNKITYGDESKAQVQVIVNHGGSVTFKAVPADGSGYVFDGWYSDKACSSANKLSSEESYTVSPVKADQNIYAKFVLKRYTIDVYAYCYNDKTPDLSEQVNYGKIKSDNETLETHTTRIVKYGQPFSFTAVGNENCEFEGWYNKADDTLIDSENVTYSVDSFKGDSQTSDNKKSFYAKFKIKTKKITVHPVKNDTTDTSTVNINRTLTTDVINYGETATISAEPGANSEFKGWFTDEACTEKVGDNYLDKNLSVTVNKDTPTNYYAKFEKKTTVTVYFKNVPGWTPPYAYVWYDNTHNESIEMTKVSDNYYKVDIDVKYTKIIFKNKDDWTGQTNGSDIPKIGDEKNCFIYDKTNIKYKGYWTKYVEETPAEKYTIYLTNNMGWDKVYCYAWNATMTTGKFPGVEMTDTKYRNDQGQAVYKVEIDSTYTSLVFSNGNDKNQTVDVTGFKNGTAYYLKEDKDKKGHYNVDTWTYIPSN
ncbi:MAG: starch-binding protein [Ruminococcaceae bacterium]|nr:starch-binding protein [Oscillospiraceae bacterium]